MIGQKSSWPKKPVSWIYGRVKHVSIPFTWNLPAVKAGFAQRSLFWNAAIVGGPAVRLMPGYFADLGYVSEGEESPGVLQRINPLATRTTVGCLRKCKFCGVKDIEPEYRELDDWPNLPLICDNNLLAASDLHIEKVMGRLVDLGQADFNQGLDCRLMTQDIAALIGEIRRPIVRLSCDSGKMKDKWKSAFEKLRCAGIAKRNIRTYCLIGFDSDPSEAWSRCEYIESHGLDAYPMWFHELDALEANTVTDRQRLMGWDDFERRKIMRWYYQHIDIEK